MRKPASQPIKTRPWDKPKPITEFEEAEILIKRFLANDGAYADIVYRNDDGEVTIAHAYCVAKDRSLNFSWYSSQDVAALRKGLRELTKTF